MRQAIETTRAGGAAPAPRRAGSTGGASGDARTAGTPE